MAPPARAGLSLVQRNQTHHFAPQHAGKLTRQHGSANLLRDTKRGIKETKPNKPSTVNAAPAFPRSRSFAPAANSNFEVYCDDDNDENNIIHQLEKKCREEEYNKQEQKPSVAAPARKPLGDLPISSLDFNSDEDVSHISYFVKEFIRVEALFYFFLRALNGSVREKSRI
ncbi:unnamed protein product [Cylicostephanus goldi]|uniref:Uncharacterized protein n=1 Tax=Cylicostephanus goldi TaxID=71465 RepID=A0A3P6R0P5_CYLGO|nr:unnamed protein product [Cylicostephanus goldi]